MTADEVIFWYTNEHGQRGMRTGDRFRLLGDPRWLIFSHSHGRREVIATRDGNTAAVVVHLHSIATIRPRSVA